MDTTQKKTQIHMDLNSIPILKTEIDKITFGLLKYAQRIQLDPPFVFTATITTKDISYLGVLKNNDVQLLNEIPENTDILFDKDWKCLTKNQLTLVTNMPIFSKVKRSRACIYIDWDNVQVSVNYIKPLLKGTIEFIHNTKVHEEYCIYVFLHGKISDNIRSTLKQNGAHNIVIVKDKFKNGDEEMLKFIRRNTIPGDSVCVASGDRDFSALMVELVRNSYNVFLIYNQQALYTFKHNKHWIGSTNIKSINGVCYKQSQEQPKKICKKKPCRFYNIDICNTINCNFLHICGFCGRSHKMQDFHPGVMFIKNVICKKYNNGRCPHTNLSCEYLHICVRCKLRHQYMDCKQLTMVCPICKVQLSSNEQYIRHVVDPSHVKKVNVFKKLLNEPPQSNHVLVV